MPGSDVDIPKMIDGTNTTVAWQMHTGKICVWGIGSFEQHGPHLPLATDVIEADYFARAFAKELGAALLPTLPFGNCFEHTGFRGSITLKPETLMQLVRDVADAVERQNFKILVLVNGHGGNFALGPVIRDINRLDRPLKILHVRPWELSGPELAKKSVQEGEFHAGEWETSLMLALQPEFVRPAFSDMPPKTGTIPLAQADMTTFGIGHLNPEGVPGFPSRASKKLGRRIVTSIIKRGTAYIRDRIARLEHQPRYAASGGIAIRQLIADDLPSAMRLKSLAGWNQIEQDWRLYMDLAPLGCFAAVQNGSVIGTATAINYGNRVSWIGMVLVDPECRRMGVATRLMKAALNRLAFCDCVKLDATPDGRNVYIKLGFQDEYTLSRMIAQSPSMPLVAKGVTPIGSRDWRSIDRLDMQVFGADRLAVLRRMAANAPRTAIKLVRKGRVAAFAFGRPGANFHQIGPVVAESEADAIAVTSAVMRALGDQPMVIDTPDARIGFKKWLSDLGFAEQRPFIRMVRGKNYPGIPRWVWAALGPEFG